MRHGLENQVNLGDRSLAIFCHFAFIDGMNANQSLPGADAHRAVRRGVTHGLG
jgi:hypothetical protein